MFSKMKFEPLVNILKTNSPTFELTLTTIRSVLEANSIILDTNDQSWILFLDRKFNVSLIFLFFNAMIKGILYKGLQHQLGQDELIKGRIFSNLVFQLISITLFLDKEILADMIDFVRQANQIFALIER